MWKLNNELLHDKEYVNLIKKTINKNKIISNHCIDEGLTWEHAKLKNKLVTIPYSIKKENVNYFKEIELDMDLSSSNPEKYYAFKLSWNTLKNMKPKRLVKYAQNVNKVNVTN